MLDFEKALRCLMLTQKKVLLFTKNRTKIKSYFVDVALLEKIYRLKKHNFLKNGPRNLKGRFIFVLKNEISIIYQNI